MTTGTSPASKPLRVEMVLPSLVLAGMEVVTLNLAKALVRRGHDVGITCIEEEGSLADQARAAGVEVRLIKTPGLWPNVVPSVLAPALRQRDPDVVHIHSGAWLKAARAARAVGVPRVVHTVHGLPERDRFRIRLVLRAGARLTDWVVAVSDPLRGYLIDRLGVPEHKTLTVLNGVDTERFAPGQGTSAFRQEIQAGNRLLLGMVARFHPVKNQASLVEAFALVRRNRKDVTLVLIGDGPERESIRELVGRLGLTSDVVFAGNRTDMPEVYRALDMFVLSSITEGTSMSILEAMASGLPIVATDVGGTSHLLGPDPVGRLVAPSDPDALADGLLDLLGDDDGRALMGRAARDRCHSHFSLLAMVKSYEDLYRPSTDAATPGGRVA